jgi:hypothetical protein
MQWAPFSLEVCSRARDCQDLFQICVEKRRNNGGKVLTINLGRYGAPIS